MKKVNLETIKNLIVIVGTIVIVVDTIYVNKKLIDNTEEEAE